MNNFTYYTPTKVVFGKGTENEVGKLVRESGATKVLIHYGTGSVERSGLLDRVKAALDEENIFYVTLGGAVPNPRLGLVYEGIALARKEKIDFVLGVGGGSAVDSAKPSPLAWQTKTMCGISTIAKLRRPQRFP